MKQNEALCDFAFTPFSETQDFRSVFSCNIALVPLALR